MYEHMYESSKTPFETIALVHFSCQRRLQPPLHYHSTHPYNTLDCWTRTSIYCSILQYTAKHCNTQQTTAKHSRTLWYTQLDFHTATHCDELAPHCNTLQHSTTHCNIPGMITPTPPIGFSKISPMRGMCFYRYIRVSASRETCGCLYTQHVHAGLMLRRASQRATVCCIVLHCVAVCCSALQCVAHFYC